VWNECEQRWYYSYVEELKPIRKRVLALEKGNYIHELLHYYYSFLRSGYSIGDHIIIDSITSRIAADLQEAEDPDYAFYADVSKTVIEFIKTQSPIIDQGITDLEVESHLEYEYDGRSFHGYADLIYRDSEGRLRVRDHKSGQRNTYDQRFVERVEQLLFYGTLYWKITGEVAQVEISFLHSKIPKNPKPGVVSFGLFTASHTETAYESYWNYLTQIHERQKSSQIMRNYGACNYCAYYDLCRADLRGYSSENIKRANYNGPMDKQDPGRTDTSGKGFTLNLRRRADRVGDS